MPHGCFSDPRTRRRMAERRRSTGTCCHPGGRRCDHCSAGTRPAPGPGPCRPYRTGTCDRPVHAASPRLPRRSLCTRSQGGRRVRGTGPCSWVGRRSQRYGSPIPHSVGRLVAGPRGHARAGQLRDRQALPGHAVVNPQHGGVMHVQTIRAAARWSRLTQDELAPYNRCVVTGCGLDSDSGPGWTLCIERAGMMCLSSWFGVRTEARPCSRPPLSPVLSTMQLSPACRKAALSPPCRKAALSPVRRMAGLQPPALGVLPSPAFHGEHRAPQPTLAAETLLGLAAGSRSRTHRPSRRPRTHQEHLDVWVAVAFSSPLLLGTSLARTGQPGMWFTRSRQRAASPLGLSAGGSLGARGGVSGCGS